MAHIKYLDAVIRGERMRMTEEVMLKTLIPRQHWELKLSDFESERTFSFITKYLQDFGKYFPVCNFLISGETGCGMTSILCYLAKELTRRYQHSVYITAHDLKNGIIMNKEYNGEDTLYSRALSVPCLLIDDLGDENARTDGGRLEGLIGSRHQRGLITHFSTKHDIKNLLGIYRNKTAIGFLETVTIPFELDGVNFYEANTKDVRKDFKI